MGIPSYQIPWYWGLPYSKASKIIDGNCLKLSLLPFCSWRNLVCFHLSFIILHLLWEKNSAAAEWPGNLHPTAAENVYIYNIYCWAQHSKNTAIETETKKEWDHSKIVGMEKDRPAPLDPLVLPFMGYNSPTENVHTTNMFQKVIQILKRVSSLSIAPSPRSRSIW